jgi:DNA invertase Pin-like site-specific DNA recombinase
MIFGYARVSTDAQDLTAQLRDLKAAGCERLFKEKVTGATADRPQLKKLLREVDHGDVVIVAAVDRLSRDGRGSGGCAADRAVGGAGSGTRIAFA